MMCACMIFRSASSLPSLKGHTDALTSLAFSSDGQYLLSGSADKTAILWNVESRTALKTFSSHKAAVTKKVAFAGGGATGGDCRRRRERSALEYVRWRGQERVSLGCGGDRTRHRSKRRVHRCDLPMAKFAKSIPV